MNQGLLDPDRGFLNKWEMHKALQHEDIGPCKLPVTALLSAQSLRDMLKQYHTIYIKPVDSWGGRGISRVKCKNGIYQWKMQGQPKRSYKSLHTLTKDLLSLHQYFICIVQQAAPLARYQKRPFDIRIHMQREQDHSWIYAGDLARVAGKSSIVSNVGISGGIVLPVENALREALDDQKAEIQPIKSQLETIGHKICQALENYRNFFEIGVDVGIDPSSQLWLIEVNTDDALGGPSHELFEQLPDNTVYQQIQERNHNRNLDSMRLLFGTLFENEI